MNINNFESFKLAEDSIDIAKSIGFHLIGEHSLNQTRRISSKGELNDNSERILVFNKNADKQTRKSNKLF